jgi:S-adenosylmethionine:tRNA ribosyltransferase-isomerase
LVFETLPAGRQGWGLRVKLIEKLTEAYVVEFNWTALISFAEIVEQIGNIPLPPYIKRNVADVDKDRYQTIYAAYDGSVAAPTAGLHFTETVFKNLAAKNITTNFVTLHVGAGTFKPVKAATMAAHEMHAEWIDVSIETIKTLITTIDKTIVAVGTTSLRTIESLYWMGVKALLQPSTEQLTISQWEIYDELHTEKTIAAKDALEALLQWLQKNNLTQLFTQTQILIAPGYQFKIAKAIVTNFHQPQSTLLLLVAAAIGNDWKKIYDYALENNFRFLSYGDGSLLFIAE